MKILLGTIVILNLLYATIDESEFDGIDPDMIEQNIANARANTDKPNVNTTQGEDLFKESGNEFVEDDVDNYKYTQEILLNHINDTDYGDPKEFKDHTSFFVKKDETDNSGKNSFWKNGGSSNNSSGSSTGSGLKSDSYIFYQGDCRVHADHKVVKKGFAKLSCELEDKSIITVSFDLQSDHTEYSLYAIPKYFKDIKGNTFIVNKELSDVTNIMGTSKNVATIVNTRAIEEINAIVLKESAGALGKGIDQHVQDLRDYRTTQQATTDANGNVVVTTNSTKPDIGESMMYAGAKAVARSVEVLAQKLETKYPWLYVAKKGSEWKINLAVKLKKD